jgi:hypothetical protein
MYRVQRAAATRARETMTIPTPDTALVFYDSAGRVDGDGAGMKGSHDDARTVSVAA